MQAFHEDAIRHADTPGYPRGPQTLFVSNASADFSPIAPWPFRVPGWAEIRATYQNMNIQNLNTVEPRRGALRQELLRRIGAEKTDDDIDTRDIDTWNLIVDLSKQLWQVLLDFQLWSPATADRQWGTEVRLAQAYGQLSSKGRTNLSPLPTTLGRIPESDAMSLVLRGYANTHTLALCQGLTTINEVLMTQDRLERLFSSSAPAATTR